MAASTTVATSGSPTDVNLTRPKIIKDIKVYGHSTILYWWPAWAFGYVFAMLNVGQETYYPRDPGSLPSSTIGLTYLVLLFLLIVVTNVRLRGTKSVGVLLGIGFIAMLIAWLGWWNDIVGLIPYLSVHMNTGFYLVFSTGLLIIWLLMFFVFDRLSYWRIRPGQLTREHPIGGGAESFDTRGLRFQKQSYDFFRLILGFGAADLKVTLPDGSETVLQLHNVPFAESKVNTIEKLIAVQPDNMQ